MAGCFDLIAFASLATGGVFRYPRRILANHHWLTVSADDGVLTQAAFPFKCLRYGFLQ